MKSGWLSALLLCVATAQAQTLQVAPVKVEGACDVPQGIQFFCADHYKPATCRLHVAALACELAGYSLEQLGKWSFVLAPSDGWKQVVRSRGGNPNSPAFTILESRLTVFEEAVFEPSPRRQAELLPVFGAGGPALLKLAASHELGHAICREPNERRVHEYGRALRERRLRCTPPGEIR